MKARLLPLLLVIPLTACQQPALESKVFYFDTVVECKLYEGNKTDLNEIKNILAYYSKISDNYEAKDISNIYSINHTNDEVTIDQELYDLLKVSFNVKNEGATYFNPLCGSLVKKWKESLKNQQILAENTINEELLKINSSSLTFKNDNIIERVGEAEIDLGGIAKGYALDMVKNYLDSKDINQYLLNAGSSSTMLGKKNTKDGLFTVGLRDLEGSYLKLKNCVISTSGIDVQGVVINGVTYSHIINPITGSAINNYDAVIVISNKGYLGDALSTSMMMNTVEEIKTIEEEQNVQVVVIKDKKIVYQNKGIEVYHH